jgi:hypothetical protein
MSFMSFEEDQVELVITRDGVDITIRHKRYISRGDRSYARSKAVKTRILADLKEADKRNGPQPDQQAGEEAKVEQPRIVTEFDPDAAQLAILERVIISWSLVFPEGHPQAGQPVPVDAEHIEMLREDVVAELYDSINVQNKGVDTAPLETTSPPSSVAAGTEGERSED